MDNGERTGGFKRILTISCQVSIAGRAWLQWAIDVNLRWAAGNFYLLRDKCQHLRKGISGDALHQGHDLGARARTCMLPATLAPQARTSFRTRGGVPSATVRGRVPQERQRKPKQHTPRRGIDGKRKEELPALTPAQRPCR